MFALTINIVAFYLGAIFIERSGIFCAVTVFLLTSLTGTILASGLERMVGVAAQRAFNRFRGSAVRYSEKNPFKTSTEVAAIIRLTHY